MQETSKCSYVVLHDSSQYVRFKWGYVARWDGKSLCLATFDDDKLRAIYMAERLKFRVLACRFKRPIDTYNIVLVAL